MGGLDYVAEQVNAVDQKLARKLYDYRRMVGVVHTAAKCKSCGYENAVVEYEYSEWVEGLIGPAEIVIGREVVCHDCAWPKVGSYLRAKEEKRKERTEEKIRQYEELYTHPKQGWPIVIPPYHQVEEQKT